MACAFYFCSKNLVRVSDVFYGMNFEEILRASSVFIEKMLEALGVLFTEQIEIIFRGFSISNFRNNLKQF